MSTRRLFFAGLTLLSLAGCKSTRNEKIEVMREPTPTRETDPFRPRPVVGEDHVRPQWPGAPRGPRGEEVDAETLRIEKARLVSVDLERSSSNIKATRESVRKVLETVPADPWVVEEHERKRVLYRRWADVATPLPEPEAPSPAPGAPQAPGAAPAEKPAAEDEDAGGGGE